ncbi:Bax inhibitor-1/YccA family protein [Exiguobacterium sp. LL15]|uniref:Bax inhibitor-1/YccA family protein n=1 Tax=Exiguobacterium sp. LL15 TaxID=2950547 RepID=UPI00210A738F|nr:Bax inhibitor-1/YccA family protein [Exiguobacterium sp. LL15]MCQ4090698.1 Bax inhibitor-1/YccA family protein [Exiguobacterium sp. LL15]
MASRFKVNPALRRGFDTARVGERPMTKSGTMSKIFLMLALVTAAAGGSWFFLAENQAFLFPALIGGFVIGLILALIITFKPATAPVLSPIYALAEGVAVGALSLVFESMYPGIVGKAVLATFVVAFAMWFVYSTGMIKVTQRFRSAVTAAILSIFVLYAVNLILSLFGVDLPFMTGSSPLAIGIQFVIVIVASLSLVMDFDFISQQVRAGAPKSMEWVAAFGLIVTIIWLYIELLDLLYRLAARD